MLKRATALFLVLLLPSVFSSSAIVYKNQGCGHCGPYIESLVEMLERNGYGNFVIKDFMSDTDARKEMLAIQERFNVPLAMQGHMLVLIDNKYLFEGHVPTSLIEAYLKNPKGPVVVTQDSMDKPTSYLMLMNGKPETCSIETPLEKCDGHGSTGDDVSSILQNPLLPMGLLVLGGILVLYYIRVN